MKFLLILAITIFALPAAALESRDHCSLGDLNGSWAYYSFAPSDNYVITCSLQISNGAIDSGTCIQSAGTSFTSSGSLSTAAPATVPQDRRPEKPLKTSDHAGCSITGTIKISYPDINLTETLTNLTVADDKHEIVGVGTNSLHLISVNFVRSGGENNNDKGPDSSRRH